MELSLPVSVRSMLATARSPPVGEKWAAEFKWDGMRANIAAAGERVRTFSRNRNDFTAGYPEITTASLGAGRCVGSPFADEPPHEQDRHAVWVAPRLVGEVDIAPEC